jgi:hypothetical protein
MCCSYGLGSYSIEFDGAIHSGPFADGFEEVLQIGSACPSLIDEVVPEGRKSEGGGRHRRKKPTSLGETIRKSKYQVALIVEMDKLAHVGQVGAPDDVPVIDNFNQSEEPDIFLDGAADKHVIRDEVAPPETVVDNVSNQQIDLYGPTRKSGRMRIPGDVSSEASLPGPEPVIFDNNSKADHPHGFPTRKRRHDET